MALIRNGLLKRVCLDKTTSFVHSRLFYSWLIEVFNRKDFQRTKEIGADRAASEWILRNGGKVKFASSITWMSQYGGLSGEGKDKLTAIDASGIAITDSGLQHLVGLQYLRHLNLQGCYHITHLDTVGELANTLEYLNISECTGLSDLTPIVSLTKLERLVVTGTLGGSNRTKVIETLRKKLPACDITD